MDKNCHVPDLVILSMFQRDHLKHDKFYCVWIRMASNTQQEKLILSVFPVLFQLKLTIHSIWFLAWCFFLMKLFNFTLVNCRCSGCTQHMAAVAISFTYIGELLLLSWIILRQDSAQSTNFSKIIWDPLVVPWVDQ